MLLRTLIIYMMSLVLLLTGGSCLKSTISITMTVTSSLNPSVYGDEVTFSVTVAPANGNGMPTGTVTFKDEDTTLGTITLDSGQATYTTDTLSIGTHSITIVYSGDVAYPDSISNALMQTVNEPPSPLISTTTTVTSSLNPSVYGDEVTFTATVAPASGSGMATGTMTFKDGDSELKNASICSGQATYTTSALKTGIRSISAEYSGDDIYDSSTSATFKQTVNGPTWNVIDGDTTVSLYSIWGSSVDNVFAVGDSGTILHYDGESCRPMISTSSERLESIWGSSSSDIFAVSCGTTYSEGYVLHYDGSNWTSIGQVAAHFPRAVWGTSSNYVIVVGGRYATPNAYRYDGSVWTAAGNGCPTFYYGVWGSSPSDIFAVGANGCIMHYTNSEWTHWAAWATMSSPTPNELRSVWGTSADDVFTVGYCGTILHYDGTDWTKMNSGTTASLNSVWGSSADDIFAVGYGGTILHYDGTEWTSMASGTTDTLYSVWGVPGESVFVVGAGGLILRHDY